MATGIPKAKGLTSGKASKSDLAQQPSIDIKLSYEGKASELEILNTPPAKLVKEASVGQYGDAPNRLYFGENLAVLAALALDPSVRGQVRLVYIDPPYATKSIFQSRQQTDAYSDLLEGAHYIEFLRARLILLRELLADDGSIYVHLAVQTSGTGSQGRSATPKTTLEKPLEMFLTTFFSTPKPRNTCGTDRLRNGPLKGLVRNINTPTTRQDDSSKKSPSMRQEFAMVKLASLGSA
jgi:hypothetical protein